MPKKHKEPYPEAQEIQKKYVHLQILKQQLSTLMQEKNSLNERAVELTTTIDALKKLADVKKGEEMWSSLGSGAFVRSDIKDIDNVYVAAGAGLVTKETRESGIEILSSRLAELQKIDEEFTAEINKLAEQAAQIEAELQHAVENK